MIGTNILRSLYTYLDVPPLDIQQETFLLEFACVCSVRAGWPSADTRRPANGDENESMAAILQHISDQEACDFLVTRGMLMTAWTNAADATEQTGVVRELSKLNGLYPGSDKGGNLLNAQFIIEQRDGKVKDQAQVKNINHIQRMSDEELAKLAGSRFLEPMTDVREPKDEGGE